MLSRKILVLIMLWIPILALAGEEKKGVIYKPASPTSAASGQEMFRSYCASCHGVDAKGSGPAASALKVAPTDLTQLAKKSGGKFPTDRVRTAIEGDANYPGHGSKDMPVWGTIFLSMRGSGDPKAVVVQRVSNLTNYVESLQAK